MEQTDALRAAVRDVADFPKPGILFKDITPILGNGDSSARSPWTASWPIAPARKSGKLSASTLADFSSGPRLPIASG